jgi:hypothetical protein
VAESPLESYGAHVVTVDRQYSFPSMADCVWYQESAQILGVRLPPDCGLCKCSDPQTAGYAKFYLQKLTEIS